MARQRRTSPALVVARARLAGLNKINPAPNLGPNLTPQAYQAVMDDTAAIEDPADNPEAVWSKKERGALLQDCLTKLPAAQREVIDLVYYHHKSVEEVAQIVGVQASTVKTRMFYARSRLAQMLNEAGVEHAWA